MPDTLIPPPLNLTTEQEFYAGGYLLGMQQLNGDSQCSVAVTRELLTDRTVPDVLYTSSNLAAQMVQESDLVPVFTSLSGPATAWVRSQSPTAGTTVSAGSQVQMELQTGPIP